MASWNIEMMDDIRQVVAVAEDVGARLRGQFKFQASLITLAARLHPHFHHTLRNRSAVNEPGDVANRVEHSSISGRTGSGSQGHFDRISDILLMYRGVNGRALALYPFEEGVNVV